MNYDKPIAELIEQRFSCRRFAERPIAADTQARLREHMASVSRSTVPFGTDLRFRLIAASDEGRADLRGLGTYGFIRWASGFIIGAAGRDAQDLEDYGYAMESLVLASTDLGLGSCWLGGTFTRSSFARRIETSGDEQMPAVTAVGYAADAERARRGLLRRVTRGANRLPWESLFFDRTFGAPLKPECAGRFAEVLELVRLAPSASNRQPWRVVKDEQAWHFYLERTPGYPGTLVTKLLGAKNSAFPDIQRVDMGIAICHFDLASREMELNGTWVVDEPALARPSARIEYVASFASQIKISACSER